MAFSISITARKLLTRANLLTTAGLNALGFSTITLTGQADTADIADDAVTPAKLEFGAYHWASTGGTANAISLTTGNSLSGTPETGEIVAFKASANNTGAVDVTVDGYSSANLFKHGATELERDDLRSGQVYAIRFDGTDWSLMGTTGQRETIVGEDAGSTDDYAFDANPAPTAYRTNMLVVFKANTASQPGATLNLNSLGAKTINKQKDQDLALGDIKAGQWVAVVYDGTNWQMVSPVSNVQAPGIPGTNAGLVVDVASVATMDVDADWLAVSDSSGNAVTLKDVDLTLNISTTPPAQNALDTSTTEAVSTGYWVYVCYDQAADTTFGLFSTNSTAPAANVAYTHWAKVGWVYNDSSGDFAQHASYRQGRWYFETGELDVETDGTVLAHTVSHPFGRVPAETRAVLVNKTADLGYTAGQEVDGSHVGTYAVDTTSQVSSRFADSSNVYLTQKCRTAASFIVMHATSGVETNITDEDYWKWKLYAEF